LSVLNRRGKELARARMELDEQVTSKKSSITLSPEMVQFFDAYGESFNLNAHGMVTMLLKGIMESTREDRPSETQLIVDRFKELIEGHEIAMSDLPQILLVLGIEVKLSELIETKSLLDFLSRADVKEVLANQFHVQKDWLKGLQVKPTQGGESWYKQTWGFCSYLARERFKSSELKVVFVKSGEFDLELKSTKSGPWSEPADEHLEKGVDQDIGIIIVREKHSRELNKKYVTYELCDFDPWLYGPCRLDVKTIMMFCQKRNIRFSGLNLSREQMDLVKNNSVLLASVLNDKMFGQMQSWYPEDYIQKHTQTKQPEEIKSVASNYKDSKLDEIPTSYHGDIDRE